MPKCKSCGANIKYIRLQTGKTMPVNAGSLIPVLPGGKKSITVITITGEVITGDPVWKGAPGALEGYVSHFATCPDADKWRKGNEKNVR